MLLNNCFCGMKKKVYTIAYKYMGNHEDASDLAQEALIKAYQSIGSFRGEASLWHLDWPHYGQ